MSTPIERACAALQTELEVATAELAIANAKVIRLRAALRELNRDRVAKRDVRTSANRSQSFHRGIAFAKWCAKQEVGAQILQSQLCTQFGYTPRARGRH